MIKPNRTVRWPPLRTVPILLLGAVALFAGCAPVECDDGFEEREGVCYEEPENTDIGSTVTDPAELADVFASLPRCVDEPRGTEVLDERRGCAGPACVGDTAAELEAALGGPFDCNQYEGYVYCDWRSWGVGAYLSDEDNDGVPDPDRLVYGLWVDEAFPGTTEDGVASGVSVLCAVQPWGTPTRLEISREGRREWISGYYWDFDQAGVRLEDDEDERGEAPGDGVAEWVYLYLLD